MGPTPRFENVCLASPKHPGLSLPGEACPFGQTGYLAGQANSLRGAIANYSLHSRVANLLAGYYSTTRRKKQEPMVVV